MPQGVRQKCRLFLEGREVPFQGAVVYGAPQSPLIATIDLVPLQTIKFIRARTQVHIFVEDTLNFGDSIPRLAFEGEVYGRAYTKAQNGRGMAIKAIDYSSYWDEAKAYYYNPNFFVGKLGEAVTGEPSIAATAQFSNAKQLTGTSTVTSIMVNLLLSSNNTDLVDGVINIIRTLTDTNFFYKLAYDRLRINERTLFGSSGNLTTFLKNLNLDDFLASYTGRQGGLISLREMLQSIMQLIFHEFVSIPFPALLAINGPAAANVGESTGSVLDYGKNIIGQFLFIPDGYTLPPPKCNVIFPNQMQKFNFEDDFRQTPTRYSFRYSLPEWLTAATAISTYPIHYYPPSMRDYMFNEDAAANDTSLLGPSTILIDPNGNTYADLAYGDPNTNAVGEVSISPTLREADFLTNEESFRGIFDSTDTFAPSVAALANGATAANRSSFYDSIGQYNFYKKRFSARNASAELLFNPFIVPGFNCILLDDSEAGQSIIAKVQGVTHNLRNDGCSTSIQLGYARDFDEVDLLTGAINEPPLPPWFDPSQFGGPDTTGLFALETSYLTQVGVFKNNPEELTARQAIKSPLVFPYVSTYFSGILGVDAITDYNPATGADPSGGYTGSQSALVTNRGAVTYLTWLYQQKSSSDSARDALVFNYIQRPIPTMYDTFLFLGAKPAGSSDSSATMLSVPAPNKFATFVAMQSGAGAGRFDGDGFPDAQVLTIRRQIINKYVNLLKTRSGFRG